MLIILKFLKLREKYEVLFIQTIINTYGGLEKVFEILLNKLIMMGHDFRFLVTDYEGEIREKDKWVKPYNLFYKKIFFWVNEKNTKALLKEFEIENFLNIFKGFKKNQDEKIKLVTNFDEKINNFFQNNNFVIFGAGSSGKKFKYILELKNKKVKYFVDNDIKKIGKTIDNIEIKHPSKIKQFKHKVIIASTWRQE